MTTKRLKKLKRHQDTCYARKGQKTGIVQGKGDICYVCEQPIKGIPTYIGKETYRHDRCCPGSAKWLVSARARVSELTEFLKRERK